MKSDISQVICQILTAEISLRLGNIRHDLIKYKYGADTLGITMNIEDMSLKLVTIDS